MLITLQVMASRPNYLCFLCKYVLFAKKVINVQPQNVSNAAVNRKLKGNNNDS